MGQPWVQGARGPGIPGRGPLAPWPPEQGTPRSRGVADARCMSVTGAESALTRRLHPSHFRGGGWEGGVSRVLQVVDLHAAYALAGVLRGVSLEVPEARVVALLGRNGAGKTTLIRAIMDMTPPEVRGGSVRYVGEELRGRSPHGVARLGIGLVPQGRR